MLFGVREWGGGGSEPQNWVGQLELREEDKVAGQQSADDQGTPRRLLTILGLPLHRAEKRLQSVLQPSSSS